MKSAAWNLSLVLVAAAPWGKVPSINRRSLGWFGESACARKFDCPGSLFLRPPDFPEIVDGTVLIQAARLPDRPRASAALTAFPIKGQEIPKGRAARFILTVSARGVAVLQETSRRTQDSPKGLRVSTNQTHVSLWDRTPPE